MQTRFISRGTLWALGLFTLGPLALAAATALAPATPFAVPHVFVAGEVALAEEVNANFDAVAAEADAIGVRIGELDDPAGVVHVAPEGGDFSSIRAALASLTGSGPARRFLVKVAPGTYTESERSVVGPYVRLEGAGVDLTRLVVDPPGPDAAARPAALELKPNAVVAHMTIENSSTDAFAFGVLAQDDGPVRLEHVRVLATGAGGTTRYGVLVADVDSEIESSEIEASGGSVTTAACYIENVARGPKCSVRNTALRASVDFLGQGILGRFADAELEDVEIDASFSGISLTGDSDARVRNSSVRSQSDVYSATSSSVIWNASCRLDGDTPAGTPTSYRYFRCYRDDLTLIDDGSGSSIE